MIRHMLLVRWQPDFPQEARQDWLDKVRALPEKIGFIRSLQVGRDVLGGQRSWDHGLVADFDSLDDVRAYAVHPDHLPLIAISGPNTEAMASVDFEI
ncbi:Dabb family protein [Raineyella fluvialis]|uniref:Dabb family protein n=1 Tax=Raineyella fluvialis TaxID=2662261 RepID=A0A5Q2FHK5_9ACTN|nr:Dabb family protein [Raineyella fluvialis]QGF23826.1 Dabb family protein [Raineyella fluvialis]